MAVGRVRKQADRRVASDLAKIVGERRGLKPKRVFGDLPKAMPPQESLGALRPDANHGLSECVPRQAIEDAG